MENLNTSDIRAIRAHNTDLSGQSDCSDRITALAQDAFDAMSIDDKNEQMCLMNDGAFARRLGETALRHSIVGVTLVIAEFEAALKAKLIDDILRAV